MSSVNIFQAFGYVCSGAESALSNCNQAGSVCAPDADHAIAIECGGFVTGRDLVYRNIVE